MIKKLNICFLMRFSTGTKNSMLLIFNKLMKKTIWLNSCVLKLEVHIRLFKVLTMLEVELNYWLKTLCALCNVESKWCKVRKLRVRNKCQSLEGFTLRFHRRSRELNRCRWVLIIEWMQKKMIIGYLARIDGPYLWEIQNS